MDGSEKVEEEKKLGAEINIMLHYKNVCSLKI